MIDDTMPYGLQYADEPEYFDTKTTDMATEPNGSYRKDTDDWDE